MITLKRILLAITLVLTVSVAATACTPAQAQQLQGILQNIDSVSGTVTILTKDGKTMTIDISTKDTVDDSSSTSVYSLEPGNSISVATDNYGRAVEIKVREVEGATPSTTTPPAATTGGIWGTITSIAGSSITIIDGRKTEVTLLVDSSTVIQFGSLAAVSSNGALSDIKVGDQVNASYELATMKALKIMVYRVKGATPPPTTTPAATTGGIWGTITSIAGGNITIIDGRKAQVTLLVDSSTVIYFGSTAAAVLSDGALSDLKVGDQVNASYDLATMKALKIMAYRAKGATPPPTTTPAATTGGIWGTVTSIAGSSITIIDERKTEVTLLVDSSTVIHFGSAVAAVPSDGALSDLKVGDQVHASYDLATMKALKIMAYRIKGATPPPTTPPAATTGGIWGTVTSIAGGNITIVDGRKAQVTLLVDSSTVVQFGSLAAVPSDRALSDLKVGDQVNVSYDLATMKALKIMVYRSTPG